MKLYYIGEGDATIVFLPAGSMTAQVTLRKEGLDYPEALAELILKEYPLLASKIAATVAKIAMPETIKGGGN